ncbi:predicted protein [Aspergillus terreus NIH2624]|uniref:Uncharacterized protein n=1 Tax=Aspergillus terreus (strain NIH 2624 / FGSC A1156) TaxID=341663 RepID=Q0CIW0_ASPTN|nr:uncharacterized protein ATEG_06374 [Aspergillus terreus NIH2624]EAU32918.1 predicted protein [Aspergillus terreus NIH2624]
MTKANLEQDSAVKRGKRPQREPSGLNEDSLRDQDNEEDIGPIHSLTSRKRRRRVIVDSDDDSEEEAGPSMLKGPSVVDKVLPSVEGNELGLDDYDEIDAILDFQLDIVDDIGEVGDDEFIPGPDDIEEGDDDSEEVVLPTTSPTPPTQVNDRFAQILRDVVTRLVEWAKGHDFYKLDPKDRPMTFGYWTLLCRVSVDFLVSLYLPAIPIQVQDLIAKSEWSLEDFASFPRVGSDKRQGIYGDFAKGALRGPSDMDVYVGSARRLKPRTGCHTNLAENYTVQTLPDRHKRSFHYRQICREGVEVDFRRCAAFGTPIPGGYLLLLEGIFMILFDTYQYPGYVSAWATRSSYRLVKEIRESLNLPSVPWRGMNAAWPLRQGFYNEVARSMSQCCNPACDKMTYPEALRPEGAPKYVRQNGNPGDPLGPYLCDFCGRYREWHKGKLPDAEVLAKVAARKAAREAAGGGSDVPCADCGRLESQLPLHRSVLRDGRVVHYQRTFRIHGKLPGKLLCEACWFFFDKNGRMRTPKEREQLLAVQTSVAIREAGGELLCENQHCKAPEVAGQRHHIANSATGQSSVVTAIAGMSKRLMRVIRLDTELTRSSVSFYAVSVKGAGCPAPGQRPVPRSCKI